VGDALITGIKENLVAQADESNTVRKGSVFQLRTDAL